jgi:NADH-quinone oxidoreductase subunit L
MPTSLLLSEVEGGDQVVQAATGIFSLTWLLIALPLLGAAVLLVGGRRTDRWGPLLAVVLVFGSFVLGALLLVQMLGQPADERAFEQSLYTWAPFGSFSVDVGLQLDQLSMSFVILVTLVGGLIHVYSLGYMAHDPDRRRFFG